MVDTLLGNDRQARDHFACIIIEHEYMYIVMTFVILITVPHIIYAKGVQPH